MECGACNEEKKREKKREKVEIRNKRKSQDRPKNVLGEEFESRDIHVIRDVCNSVS